MWAFLRSDDEKVSPTACDRFLRAGPGGPIAVTTCPGATHDFDNPGAKHDFDDPGAARQAVPGNGWQRSTR